MKKRAKVVSNGLMRVPNIKVAYRGYQIEPKLDFGGTPFF